ncbi:hypothetical protein HanIR_Chr16g0798001 [Helianthus annuus]|nr:hypothetical protein HanIR_Chr16g0798001 [Helianthus annuus]
MLDIFFYLIDLFCFLHPFLGNAFQVTDFAFSLCVVDLSFLPDLHRREKELC